MVELSRRQFAGAALSLGATTLMPVPIVQAISELELGDPFERTRADRIREIAEIHAEFCWCERNFETETYARDVWWLVHSELATSTDMTRRELRARPALKRVLQPWLNALYPPVGVRAWCVPPPLSDLSPAFAALQRELDAVTAELGEAAYELDKFRRKTGWPKSDHRYQEQRRPIARLISRQKTAAENFVYPQAMTQDDRIAMRRAADIHHSYNAAREINARRRHWLRLHQA